MLYNEDKVNLLIALLGRHGVRRVVLCPGSRDAIIVNNIVESGLFDCYPVTDERSAGFYALGMALEGEPAAIVVTSGSALLNVAPAVVEAYYQHVPLVVVSADRPQEDIGQNVGQTMRQYGALDNYVRRSVNLTDAMGANVYYYNQLINEALCEAMAEGCGPVHINVPLPDPSECETTETVDFNVGNKFAVAPLYLRCTSAVSPLAELQRAERPMLIIGQDREACLDDAALRRIKQKMVVLSEPLSDACARPYEGLIDSMPQSLLPDLIIYIGGTTVCRKTYKRFAENPNLKVWRVGYDYASPFRRLDGVVRCSSRDFIAMLDDCEMTCSGAFVEEWERAFREEQSRLYSSAESGLSADETVKYFEEQLEDMEYDYHVHYANSTAVRLACRYAYGHKVWCNRGVNGIEGSLSTAAGFSAVRDDMVFCVVGDLSFFYDQNALWNTNIKGNLRIILLNDHHGGIFDKVKGLRDCARRDEYIAGAHKADARGICTQNDVGYLSAKTVEEMHIGIVTLMTAESSRPMVLELLLS